MEQKPLVASEVFGVFARDRIEKIMLLGSCDKEGISNYFFTKVPCKHDSKIGTIEACNVFVTWGEAFEELFGVGVLSKTPKEVFELIEANSGIVAPNKMVLWWNYCDLFL